MNEVVAKIYSHRKKMQNWNYKLKYMYMFKHPIILIVEDQFWCELFGCVKLTVHQKTKLKATQNFISVDQEGHVHLVIDREQISLRVNLMFIYILSVAWHPKHMFLLWQGMPSKFCLQFSSLMIDSTIHIPSRVFVCENERSGCDAVL